MTVRITPDDGLVVEWQTSEEAESCLRDLKMYKALLLLRRRMLEQLISRVDGATVEIAGQTKRPLPLEPLG